MGAEVSARWVLRAELLGMVLLAVPVTAYAASRGQVLRGLGAGVAVIVFAALLNLELRRDPAIPRRPPVVKPLWLQGAGDTLLLGIFAVADTTYLLRDHQPLLASLEALGAALIVASAWITFRGWRRRHSAPNA
jgi:hypothetical protein